MGLNISISGVARVSAQPAETPTSAPGGAAPATRGANTLSLVELDETTNQPVPLRFPWLSRLTAQLEPSAVQKPPFPSTPQLGEIIDRAV